MRIFNHQRGAFFLFFIGITMWAWSSARFSAAQAAEEIAAIRTTTETTMSGSDWKLGSFSMGDGEKARAFSPSFDDHSFRTVKVPGEVQLQIGLQGMDLYYQSKQLTLVNEKEWWYRKQFVVPKAEAGKLLRLVFDGRRLFCHRLAERRKAGRARRMPMSPFRTTSLQSSSTVKKTWWC